MALLDSDAYWHPGLETQSRAAWRQLQMDLLRDHLRKAALRTTPDGQPNYSDLAITTALTVRAIYRLALRQTEGLIGSILHLLGTNATTSAPPIATVRALASSKPGSAHST